MRQVHVSRLKPRGVSPTDAGQKADSTTAPRPIDSGTHLQELFNFFNKFSVPMAFIKPTQFSDAHKKLDHGSNHMQLQSGAFIRKERKNVVACRGKSENENQFAQLEAFGLIVVGAVRLKANAAQCGVSRRNAEHLRNSIRCWVLYDVQ